MDIKDIKTVDDLRKACPDMVAKIETEAINAERTRIQEIENATLPGAEDEANEAKFVKPIDSASFAKAVIASMKAKQQKQSKDYLDKAKANAQTSGANNITNPPPADPAWILQEKISAPRRSISLLAWTLVSQRQPRPQAKLWRHTPPC